ncbi:transcription factor FAMA-like [Zingiber officinale]|uniref:transcription factor FAMA-like n=1 Tax=Zingiber officinale TaxID=94328 RepID=UPI001C4BFBB8|nr:transcription factor FAMA-like [Zingiber officinale]
MDKKEADSFAPALPPPERSENGVDMVNYMVSNPPAQAQISLDKLSFADVMQFAEFGPRLSLQQSKVSEDESYFLRLHDEPLNVASAPPLLPPPPPPATAGGEEDREGTNTVGRYSSENAPSSVQELRLVEKAGADEAKNISSRRKRPRAMKTNEEVESQRMTHIAVERNRRRQMNENLRVLRSLMPGSYVQRGDQASIIGGAIEFVRELEQLLQCLESQKRRRLFGNTGEPPRAAAAEAGGAVLVPNQQRTPSFYPPLPLPTHLDQAKLLDFGDGGLPEETAENKSCLAEVEVRLLGSDAMIKILSRRRPGQLIKTIAALEDLQFAILHTNITTIEQTVLYSFNVKIGSETRCTAEDIASSVQQILSFIDANTV